MTWFWRVRRAITGVAVTLLLAVTSAACGSSAASRRQDAQTEAAHRVGSVYGARRDGLLCVRFPPQGPIVEVYVTTKASIDHAKQVLAENRVAGTAKVLTARELNRENRALAEQVGAHRPTAPDTLVETYATRYTGGLVCPTVEIAVPEGDSAEPVIAWANQMLHRYGRDRVHIRHYNTKGTPAPIE